MTSGKAEKLVGQIVDGYRILEIAGSGGMGVVFKAVNIGLAKTVALKMIDPAMAANERFQQSFQSEARALARTDTSNIVRVYDLRSNEHGLFIVMEFVEGETVADVIETRGGRLPWQEGLPIVQQALAALDHAHDVGVVHRDIKPGNLMIEASGTVKVTDFG
ncbi:MAG: serine/threonine-protein kinase, partial [Rhodothermales bacterium]|nr:serine/threonine-protein kinase [Rhodothermales bacterium]